MKKTNVLKLTPGRTESRTLKLLGKRVSALWNTANFLCRQTFFKDKQVPSYSRLCSLLKNHKDYRALPSDIAQEVLKKVSKAWRGYFKLLKLYNKGQLKHKPGLPRYRKDRKTGKRPFDFIPVKSSKAYSVKNGYISLTLPSDIRNGRLQIPFKGILRYREKLKTCEFRYDHATQNWYAHIVVEVSDPARKPKPIKYATADIGVKRTIAVTIQRSRIAYVFSARQLWKDYKYWSRHIAEEQSRLSQQGLKTSRKLKRLYRMRQMRLKHALETMSRKIALELKKRGVTHFKVGYPKNCRESMNFGRNNSKVHNFWNFKTVLDILEKHCQRRGIELERVDETGTSKVCHICNTQVKRPVRSQVICPLHGRTHADVNASLNMLKSYTLDYGDGLKASLVWVTHEWNKHSWLPRTESLRYLSQVLQVA